ncbi:MAG: glycerol-3-phosphate 1-O-acyltransferase PlsY [Rhodoplanes sp.]
MSGVASDSSALQVLAVLVGYLFGSIPFGLLLSRLAGLGDIRKIGSGNIGTTNVLRTGSKSLAALTLLCDAGKGIAAVLIMGQWGQDLALLAGFFAVVGHNFPLWLKFRGGKGVATTLGVLLALAWPVGLIACVTWLAVAIASRYSSLAALAALAVAPAAMYALAGIEQTLVAALLAVLGIARHHANIRRLIRGKEARIEIRRSSGR